MIQTRQTQAVNMGFHDMWLGALESVWNADTSTVVPAAVTYENELCRLQGRFNDAIGQANLGCGVDSTFYAAGVTSTNVQVCFAAGYEIELTDGTRKKIEDFEGGEEIWARHHNDPSGPLQKCKVTRAFKNGVKETMLVKFNTGLELRGTAEHPFYVNGKGWTPLGELTVGYVCFDREQKPIVVTDIICDGKQVEVYNIEVEGCHTYYIGKDGLDVLVHNECISLEFVDIFSQNPNDRLIAQLIKQFTSNLKPDWKPGNLKDNGEFGKAAHKAIGEKLKGVEGWYADVYVYYFHERRIQAVLELADKAFIVCYAKNLSFTARSCPCQEIVTMSPCNAVPSSKCFFTIVPSLKSLVNFDVRRSPSKIGPTAIGNPSPLPASRHRIRPFCRYKSMTPP